MGVMRRLIIVIWVVFLMTGCTMQGKQDALRVADQVMHLTGKVDDFEGAHDALHAEIEALESEEKGWLEILGSVGLGMLGLHQYRNHTRKKEWEEA